MDSPRAPGFKVILLALADEADDAGVCAASDEHVARKCAMSEETYLQKLRLLESQGLIAIDHREDNARRGVRHCTLTLL
jgi:hypothetical protein